MGFVAITIGFDLDMTLIDPRPGMVAVMNALGEESGLPLDGEYFAAHLGPPLDHVLKGRSYRVLGVADGKSGFPRW